MSIEVMSRVWKHSHQSGGRLLLLLAIADYSGQNGYAFPSLESLAQKSRMTVRNVQRILSELETNKEIEVIRNQGPRGCNLYRVLLPGEGGGDKLSGGGEISGPKMSRRPDEISGPKISPNPSVTVNRVQSSEEYSLSNINRQEPSPSAKEKAGAKTFHQEFIDGWSKQFQERFGVPYAFVGGKDGKAVKELSKLSMSAEELLAIAAKGWASKNRFYSRVSRSIAGFCSRINDLRVEARNGHDSDPHGLAGSELITFP